MKKIKYIIFGFCIFSINIITFANINKIEYQIDKQGHLIEEIKKPTAKNDDETMPNILIAKTNSDKRANTILYGPGVYEESETVEEVLLNEEINKYNIVDEELSYLNKENIIYIRHTNSVTDVDKKFNWQYFDLIDKWKLLVDDSPYSIGYAKNGFYKIEDVVYYFNNDEFMVTGIVIDNRNIKYIFDNTGALIKIEQL